MANTALNRTLVALLTNKSGGSRSYGDVVVLDNTNANGFTTTTTAGLATRQIGVVIEPAGIANNASGTVATGGWVPQVNLNTAATVGQFLKTYTVAGQATPHSSPQIEGDFGVALTASATPPCVLFGSPNQPQGATVPAGSSGDIQYNNAGAFGGITVVPGLQGGGLVLLEQHAASTSASLNFTTCITSTYDEYLIEFLQVIPATNAVTFQMRMSTNGGSSYDNGSNYASTTLAFSNSASGLGGNTPGSPTTQINFRGDSAEVSNSASYGVNGSMRLFKPGGSIFKMVTMDVAWFNSTSVIIRMADAGAYLSNTAVNAFQFFFSSGNIASGTIRVYGVAK